MPGNVSSTQHVMKGLTKAETQSDFHFRKVSDMPPSIGHNTPGIHYSNANRNGFWKGYNKTASVRTVKRKPVLICSDS